jgi:hypothetical protein
MFRASLFVLAGLGFAGAAWAQSAPPPASPWGERQIAQADCRARCSNNRGWCQSSCRDSQCRANCNASYNSCLAGCR